MPVQGLITIDGKEQRVHGDSVAVELMRRNGDSAAALGGPLDGTQIHQTFSMDSTTFVSTTVVTQPDGSSTRTTETTDSTSGTTTTTTTTTDANGNEHTTIQITHKK